MIFRTVLIWFGLLIVATLNGGFREVLLVPRFGRGVGQALSTIMLSLLIAGLGWISLPWIAPQTRRDAWTIGVLWVVLTLAFEFIAGHFVFGKPWRELMADYDVLHGRIWVMVLIVTLMTPIVAFTKRGL
jgi:hypothetical protein